MKAKIMKAGRGAWGRIGLGHKAGMEMVQVAILIALAIALGVIFKSEITQFVNDVFSKLKA